MANPTDANGREIKVGDRVRYVSTGESGTVARINSKWLLGVVDDGDGCEYEIHSRSIRVIPTGDAAVQELREALAPSTPVFGPYEEERQAYADAPYRDSENAKERRNGCAELLRAVCREAGVELGDYDEEIVRLLSRLGPEVVQVVAGMISRAGAR
jgi:hypothetical protein